MPAVVREVRATAPDPAVPLDHLAFEWDRTTRAKAALDARRLLDDLVLLSRAQPSRAGRRGSYGRVLVRLRSFVNLAGPWGFCDQGHRHRALEVATLGLEGRLVPPDDPGLVRPGEPALRESAADLISTAGKVNALRQLICLLSQSIDPRRHEPPTYEYGEGITVLPWPGVQPRDAWRRLWPTMPELRAPSTIAEQRALVAKIISDLLMWSHVAVAVEWSDAARPASIYSEVHGLTGAVALMLADEIGHRHLAICSICGTTEARVLALDARKPVLCRPCQNNRRSRLYRSGKGRRDAAVAEHAAAFEDRLRDLGRRLPRTGQRTRKGGNDDRHSTADSPPSP